MLLVNMTWFAGRDSAVTAAQFAALPTAPLDRWVEYLMHLLVYAKAETLFGISFGVSFSLQMERFVAKSRSPRRLYGRRLIGLLAIGIVHTLALWSGDILHVYAIAGFALMLVYRWRTGVLVGGGLALAVVSDPVLVHLDVFRSFTAGDSSLERPLEVFSPEAMAARLAVFQSADWLEILAEQARFKWAEYVVTGGIIGWLLHALGRFMLGLAVARQGYLLALGKHRMTFLWIACVGLPAGMAMQHSWALRTQLDRAGWVTDPGTLQLISHLVTSCGVVLMAAGYIALLCLGWQSRRLRPWLRLLAPTGQMALTNYLLQSIFNSFVFFGIGFGLIGRVGISVCVPLSIAFYVFQAAVSKWWLATYRFGPVEWLWRWWTYRKRPPFRQVPA